MFAEDMSLVTDNNIDGRKRIRRNDGTKLMIDPSLYKNNLQKFSDNTIDEQSNKVRLEAIKQRALEKDKITQALRKNDGSIFLKSKNHIIFSANDLAAESGREHLNLQKKFCSDDRFRLTSDFVSDDENIDTDENNIVQNGDTV
ncbi:hypothetical protein C2G38_2121853 [Gigaspora rosea]|uniref:Uncharacterized protein n=1 Tax=Gigaspora rosea TaxID=44941 RepID=A0A397U4H5_9GLOM|nr:hypothetical protein C2G38_2121853 [Gigaspora rosea]